MTTSPDSANILQLSGQAPPTLVIDGSCIRNTIQALEVGSGTAKPLSRDALEKTRGQATSLLAQVIRAYEDGVAPGEVGAGGSGRASGDPPKVATCPTGLLYGRIQSGKTVGMIQFSALAIDNGFRVVVVLTSDNVKLVDQTAKRFSALDGMVMSSTNVLDWPSEIEHVKKNLPSVGLVLVCAKNQSHLASLVQFLDSIGAGDHPALILDDEADQATLDTTVAARSKGRPSAPKFGSTINRRTLKNDRPGETGLSVAEVLRHFVFLQVTATPYALLLQNAESPLRPKFSHLLEPGAGYTGGEAFFSTEQLDKEAPPLVLVREEESDELERGIQIAPPGLASALSFFMVSAGAQAINDSSVRGKPQNFLCHTSQKRTDHETVSNLIRLYIGTVGDELRKENVGGEVGHHFARSYEELKKTLPKPWPALETIVADLRQRLPRRHVVVVNSDGLNADFPNGINFIVGGNILGRGLTIENLLVTYYLRRAKISQMDTMLQHARMFGYRREIMPYTRVFLPERLALRFHRIHTAEHHLRSLLSDPERRARIPVQVSEGLRATRPDVLDINSILAYTPGQHIRPALPLVSENAAAAHERAKRATLALGGVFLPERDTHALVEVGIDALVDLIPLLPYDDVDEDEWDPRAIQGLLRSIAPRFGGRALLYSRQMHRKKFSNGALNGPAIKRLASHGLPVVCVFLDTGREFRTLRGDEFPGEFIYPSLVLPESAGMPAHLFNVT